MPYTTYELNPADPGYVKKHDYEDDGSHIRVTLLPVNDPSTSVVVSNFAGLITKLQNALNANQTYLNLASPTNVQNTAQVQRLTREVQALIYIQLHALVGINTTPGT